MNTFKSVGSSAGPVIGGFFLSDVTRHVVTLDQAFHNVFWFGAGAAVVSVVLILALIALGRRKAE